MFVLAYIQHLFGWLIVLHTSPSEVQWAVMWAGIAIQCIVESAGCNTRYGHKTRNTNTVREKQHRHTVKNNQNWNHGNSKGAKKRVESISKWDCILYVTNILGKVVPGQKWFKKQNIIWNLMCSFCRSYHKLKYVMEKKVKEHAVVANSKLYEAGAVYKLYDEIRAIQC